MNENFSARQVHELPSDKLQQREVVRIDISNDAVAANDYKEDEDPSKFKSKKTNRGPLVGNWMEKVSRSQSVVVRKVPTTSM